MEFGRSILGNYKEGTDREYLITNGMGSFSGGSINGNHARRYHGLLVSSFLPPLDRFLVFHHIKEELDGIPLGVRKIKGDRVSVSEGYRNLDNFSISPFPKFIYSVNGIIFEKEIFMRYGVNAVFIKYKVLSSVNKTVNVKFNLEFNYRDFHQMGSLNKKTDYFIEKEENVLKIWPYENANKVYLYSNAIESFVEDKKVIQNIAYDIEFEERGEIDLDNTFNIGYLTKQMNEGEEIYIAASIDKLESFDINKLRNEEIERIDSLKQNVSLDDNYLRDLAVAADNFIVYRAGTNGKTILAGFPWFSDWGRDTMIALPGLTLATKRFDDAKSILSTFAKYCSEGMLPNKFPDYNGEPLYYNTIDASLWFFYAVYKFVEYTGDYSYVKDELYEPLKQIIEMHIKGTRYKIKVDESDGLVSGGDFSTQLTWMDARYEGWAVTPRFGKAVEINALWYNALRTIETLSEKYGEDSSMYKKYAEKITQNFEKEFWNEKKECLYDYLLPDKKVDDIRPNQIFAVSLPFTMLPKDKESKIVDVVTEKLYTSHGLRSISADNEKYIGIYQGTLFQRDACYHQGTVWSWPIGHFITAHKKIYNDKNKLNLFLNGLKTHFYQEGCIKNVSEIFDGDAPFTARGCYAQAWSIGELLRVIKEDILDDCKKN